jgi:hypothetical protein
MALAEMPAPHFGEAAWKGQDVISDSAWFRRDSERPEVLVEFERYSDEMDAAKLAGKVQNLVLGHWRWAESPRLLVLAYWSKGLRNLPDHQKLRSIVRDGFQTIARESVKGCRNARIVFVQFLFDEAPGNRWKLARVLERGVA